jgi:hypothetical protein
MPKQPNLPGNAAHISIPIINQSTASSPPSNSATKENSLSARIKRWTKLNSTKSFLNRRRSADGLIEETKPLSSANVNHHTTPTLTSTQLLAAQNRLSMRHEENSDRIPVTSNAVASGGEVARDTHVSAMENGSYQTRLLSPLDSQQNTSLILPVVDSNLNEEASHSSTAATLPKSEFD